MDPDDDILLIGRQFGRFMRAADRFHQGVVRADEDGPGLERAAYLLLSRIAAEPARLSRYAADMCVDVSTASRQVAALESAGLVSRTSDPTDRRASLIEATPTGHRVLARNRARWLAGLRELLDGWTAHERQTFGELLTRLNDDIMARAGAGGGGADRSCPTTPVRQRTGTQENSPEQEKRR